MTPTPRHMIYVVNTRTPPTKYSPEILKQITDLVKPQPDQLMQHQFDILAAVAMIEKMPGYVSPTVERRLLLDVAAKLAAVQVALDALPQYTGLIAIDALPVSYGLRNDALPVITDIAKRVTKMADKITAKRRNGASPKRYTIAQQKRIAAEHAVYLLKDRKQATKKQTKAVTNDMAALLFQCGTGRALTGRAFEKACAKALSAN
jgi:hypothetical protein